IIKYRHKEDIIRRLLSSEWWNLSVEYLKSLPSNNPEEFLNAIENSSGPLPKATYSVLRVSNKKVQ
ncbi:antibiotic acetyltransferase, partial [Pseudomonas putida]|nr:antibiotic acetyltransferase [Pseudomonas putida]